MSTYSRLSIWNNDPNAMSWYDYVVGRTTPTQPFVTPNAGVGTLTDMRPDITQGNHEKELSYQNRWFQALKAEDRKKAMEQRLKLEAMYASVTKPAAPSKKTNNPEEDPYFDYLFSDAGLGDHSEKSGNSIDNLSHDKLSNSENQDPNKPLDEHYRRDVVLGLGHPASSPTLQGMAPRRHVSETPARIISYRFLSPEFSPSCLDIYRPSITPESGNRSCDSPLPSIEDSPSPPPYYSPTSPDPVSEHNCGDCGPHSCDSPIPSIEKSPSESPEVFSPKSSDLVPCEPSVRPARSLTFERPAGRSPYIPLPPRVFSPSPSWEPMSPGEQPQSRSHSPTSPIPGASPPWARDPSPDYNPTSPDYNPTSPDYNPTSPDYNPTSPRMEDQSQWASPSSPCYSPTSPTYDPRPSSFSPCESTGFVQHTSLARSSSDGRDHGPKSPDRYIPVCDTELVPNSPLVYNHSYSTGYGLGLTGVSATDKGHMQSDVFIASPRSSHDQYFEETPLLSNENAVIDPIPSHMLVYSPSPIQTPPINTPGPSAPTEDAQPLRLWQHESRPTLKPKSQQAKADKSGPEPNEQAEATPAGTVASRHLRSPSVEIIKVVKKRAAPESFESSQIRDRDDDVQYICTKKVRTSIKHIDQDFQLPTTPLVPETVTLSDTSSLRTISRDFFNHKPLAVAPKGYPGQFTGMKVNRKIYEDDLGTHHTFGSLLHPNGTFTHTSITFDTLLWTKDFTKELLPTGHPLKRCMEYATDMTIIASGLENSSLRSRDEEILRREAHIECANARLEGVSVGFLRYYHGHLDLEEYHGAQMCICWDLCSCSKMCSRFADMKCPCSKHIVIHSD